MVLNLCYGIDFRAEVKYRRQIYKLFFTEVLTFRKTIEKLTYVNAPAALRIVVN